MAAPRKDTTAAEQAPDQPTPTETEGRPLPTVVQALNAARREVGAVRKDSTAPGAVGGYQFRGVDAVVNATSGILARHGILVVPEVLAVDRATTEAKGGRAMLNVYVRTRFTFYGPMGDSVSCTVLGEAADAGDKATSKAQSVALRVALLQTLLLPTDEPDPDAEGYERADYRRGEGQPSQDRPQRRQDAQEGSQEPGERPAHLAQFYGALEALSADQQAWVREHWPIDKRPDRMTVNEAAQAVEWMARNVPPAQGA